MDIVTSDDSSLQSIALRNAQRASVLSTGSNRSSSGASFTSAGFRNMLVRRRSRCAVLIVQATAGISWTSADDAAAAEIADDAPLAELSPLHNRSRNSALRPLTLVTNRTSVVGAAAAVKGEAAKRLSLCEDAENATVQYATFAGPGSRPTSRASVRPLPSTPTHPVAFDSPSPARSTQIGLGYHRRYPSTDAFGPAVTPYSTPRMPR